MGKDVCLNNENHAKGTLQSFRRGRNEVHIKMVLRKKRKKPYLMKRERETEREMKAEEIPPRAEAMGRGVKI